MSDFFIRAEEIESLRPHPNADRLDIARLVGIDFQFVVGRGQQKAGDRVLYFPLDAILPDDVASKLGLLGKLAGKAKNRVKTIKLRGEISQGLVGPLDILTHADYDTPERKALLDEALVVSKSTGESVDFAPFLGIIKYDPEEHHSGGPNQPRVKINPLPTEVRKYDIESCQRYRDQVQALMDVPVIITEKMEGCHTAVLRRPDGDLIYCSRNCELKEPDTHWHKAAQFSRIPELLEILAHKFQGKSVTVRGETVGPGVQGNIYKLDHLEMLVFDIEVDGSPVDADDMYDVLLNDFQMVAPVLSRGLTLREWLAQAGTDDIVKASDGQSVRGKTLREGIVIKPCREMYDPKLGRLFLKQRSPEYLCGHET